MATVFIALQKNEESRAIVDAILADNPQATANNEPAMVKVDAPERMVIRRETVEQEIGRDFDLQEIHVNLVTLSGNVDQTDDEFTLSWV
ncbi:MAG: MmoB/DmpM family protein [Ottowia sp.]|nr:MmoB/DmpM family protein [Ottowia sp.]